MIVQVLDAEFVRLLQTKYTTLVATTDGDRELTTTDCEVVMRYVVCISVCV